MPFIGCQDISALNAEKYSILTQVMAFRLLFPKVQRSILLKNSQSAFHLLESDFELCAFMKYYLTGEWGNGRGCAIEKENSDEI